MSTGSQTVVTLTVKFVLDEMFAVSEHDAMSMTPTELQAKAGISKGYASDLLAGHKKPSASMALRIFRTTGVKLGPIANLADDEVAVFERVYG